MCWIPRPDALATPLGLRAVDSDYGHVLINILCGETD